MTDMINHPPHYDGRFGMQAVDCLRNFLTEEEYRGWCKGSAMTYIMREKKKGHDEDLKKAGWFLDELNKGHGKVDYMGTDEHPIPDTVATPSLWYDKIIGC